MRRNLTILIALLSIVAVNAQSPEKISYQAVIRDADNQLVTNSNIGMQISILQGVDAASATAVYVERQFPATNSNGLASIEIGGSDATVVSGAFSEIDWSTGTYFIKSETDPSGGSNYTITGISQLLSVPYALYAKDVENNDDDDANPLNEIQALTITDHTIALSNGGGEIIVPDEIDDADADPQNELQVLSYADDSLTISKGNSLYFDINNPNYISTIFPQGFNYDIIINDPTGPTTLTVPDGKTMYVLNARTQLWVNIEGQNLDFHPSLASSPVQLSVPIFPSGTEITFDNAIMYYFVDNDPKITPVLFYLRQDNNHNYTVPSGKKLIIKSISDVGSTYRIWLDDLIYISYASNVISNMPIIPQNITLSTTGTTGLEVCITGFLIDN